jgi:hypothetical protein
MEQDVMIAVQTIDNIKPKFGVQLEHTSNLYLKDVVEELTERYKDVDFT